MPLSIHPPYTPLFQRMSQAHPSSLSPRLVAVSLKRSENLEEIASVGKCQNEVGRASTGGRWANSY